MSMAPPINQSTIDALSLGIDRCNEILIDDLGYVKPRWAHMAFVCHLMVNLNDVLRILGRAGHRLSFTDNLPPDTDVTSQVKTVRDAMCHIGSGIRGIDEFENILNFGWAQGKNELMEINGVKLECPFTDDQAIFMGQHRLLVKRHIRRSVTEASELGPKIAFENGELYWPA